VLALLMALGAAPAAACGREDAACETALGGYHVALPSAPEGAPAVMFLHGAGGSGAGVLSMSGMVAEVTARGYAVIAPDGLPWQGRGGGIWSFLPEAQRPKARDEGAFLIGVAVDAAERFGLDPDRVLLAGFSAGGFMVSYLACDDPDGFPAYAPVAGGFWRPHPEACAGPVRLLHTHGLADTVVPLEGRPLGGGRFLQGDIFEGMAIWRAANGCARPDPDAHGVSGAFSTRRWDCAPGSALGMALHPGGHSVPEGWAAMTLDWFEALPEG
jgi:polyhydroxybutyrate depolymerase